MRQQRLPLPILLLLLLLLDGGECGVARSNSKHNCPGRTVSRSKCRSDGLQSQVIIHYEWNRYLKRCQKKIQLNEVSCDRNSAKKGVCPEPRTVEPGRCNKRNNLQKTLVMHYEPDGKGGCVLHKDYTYPNCPEKKTAGESDSGDCPEPRYYQKPCSGRHRQVFKFYYIRGKAKSGSSSSHECIEKTSITVEACGAFVTARRCPSSNISERGRCKNGFRTLIRTEYSRDPAGKCVESSHKVTQSCGDGEAELPPCPPNVLKQGPCLNGLRHITRQYYERNRRTGNRCIRKFSIENRPCGKHKAGVCPKPRVLEPGPCTDGRTRVLVAHYEPDPITGRCREQRSFTVMACGKQKASSSAAGSSSGGHSGSKSTDGGSKSSEVAQECPDKTYSQGPCKKGYRNLFTFTYRYSPDLKRCIKHVTLKREQCAALVATEACPADDTVEAGPCRGGFRTNILYHYSRNAEGQCHKKVKKVTSPCRSKRASVCPPKRVKKVGGCKDRIQRWLTVYFEWSKLKGRCVRKFRAREKPCGGAAGGLDASGATKRKKCPKRRVMEPGPCKDGARKVLVEHYEYSKTLGRCVAHRDFVTQKCGKKVAKKRKSTPGIDLKHECPEKTVSQSACRTEGYRTVTTVYFVFVKALSRCVRKVKQEDEKCALLVKLASCPKDAVVEAGPCTHGFRTNIIYRYSRDLEGRCVRTEKSVTEPCRGNSADCKPSFRKLLKPCSSSGFERWLTTYYVYNKLKKRCVRKLRYKEVSCRRVSKCPTPRVIEPSPCHNGKQRLLIEHYELDAKLGRCRMKRDFVHRTCGKPTKRQTEAAKHHCPESIYHQKTCRSDGYRSVLKIYYRYNAAKGRCVRNVRVDDEKCSKLVAMRESCKADEMVEEGPCKRGFRENIIYRYERNADGSCVRKEHRVTLTCVGRKVVP